MADSLPLVKTVLCALLLLFQLQPVLGTIACLGTSERAAGRECQMPEQPHVPGATATIGAPDAGAHQCELAALCAPAPLCIPGLGAALLAAVPLLHTAAPLSATQLLGLTQAPPFHPPRA